MLTLHAMPSSNPWCGPPGLPCLCWPMCIRHGAWTAPIASMLHDADWGLHLEDHNPRPAGGLGTSILRICGQAWYKSAPC